MVPDTGSGRAGQVEEPQLSRGPRGVMAMWMR